VAKLTGVVNVSSKQSKVFIIQLATDEEKAQSSDIEMRLFTLFNQHKWQYKMLLKGRTLEETLFS
jgi:hypothetical protein